MGKVIGFVLIVLGTLMLAYQGIRYTTRETVVEVGSLHVETEKKKTVPLPPVVGGVTLATGVILLVTASRKGG